ncbi:MAG: N-acetyl-alpha-D-glucosaminyl L-malate synthase BshA [Bacteroidetes bacterium]|nr:N-acetyl-alpha-D-glucosaminyl L-malate synthase BshA [Bacteroidota bacterium]
MNIGIVCYPTYGGSGVVASELGKVLASKGHKVHFISYEQPVRLDFFSENLFYHEVTVSNYPLFQYPPYELALTAKIIEVVKNSNIQILHVHYAIPHAAAAVMAKKILKDIDHIKIPVITTLHGTDITLVGNDANYGEVISYSLNQSDAVTAVSESLKNDTYKYFSIKKNINVIPNFINIEKYKKDENACSRRVFATENEFILMHTSNFRKVKRIEDVVEIFVKVNNKKLSKLILAGDGPERSNIEQLCNKYNIANRVYFLGKQDNIEKILSISDVFLMPSETESFGLAALEAMACGVPVVSTDTGGLPELNKNGFSGYTANLGNVNAMSNFVLKIIESPETLDNFRKNARLQAESFATEKVIPQYENLYNTILNDSI